MDQQFDMRPRTEESKTDTDEAVLTDESTRHIPERKSTFTLKRKVQIGLGVAFALLLIYGYWWVSSTSELRAEALILAEQAEQYESLVESIASEKDRCESFITQGQGDFASFEYCKAFITWANRHLSE